MIFDTDVLIWFLRGNIKAVRVLDATTNKFISVVSFMELLQGSRNKQETLQIKQFIKNYKFTVLPLTENISHRSLIYIEDYGLKNGLMVADSLIAATAAEELMTLCTANIKHFRIIRDLMLKNFKPN